MRLTDQLQSVLSAAASMEKEFAEQGDRVSALVAEIAALREKLPTPPTARATQWGFAANDADPTAAVKAGLVRMKADGGVWLRLWTSNFGSLSGGNVALIDAAADAGVSVILCVQPKDGEPEPFGTPDFAGFVAKNAARLRKCAYVEAGNELNLVQYRPDDFGGGSDWHGPYVARWLKPLSTALATIGVKTLCTSVTDTYTPANYAPQHDALLAAGAAACCDGVALHCYFRPQSLTDLTTILTNLGRWNKPVYVTECNVLTKGLSPAQWQAQIGPYLSTLKTAGVAAINFYRGVAKPNGKWTWPVLFDDAGKPTDAYATVLAAMK